jgi:outer membrane scaffolding protein for murein synthesis (MipA/OmpV family)
LSAIGLLLLGVPAARAQTPTPLQEWQFSSGIVLRNMFDPQPPEWQVILGPSVSLAPIYDGAKPYHVRVGPNIDIRYRDIAFLSVGEGLGVNVLRGENYRAGIALGYDLGRRVNEYPSHLSGLGNIPAAPALKLFAAYAISKEFPLVIRADIRRILGASDGFLGDLGAYIPLPGSSQTFVMFAGPSVTVANDNYMERTFGVDLPQSLRSGFPVYKAHAGVKAAGFGLNATWLVTDHWLFDATTAMSRLFDSAANSPITQRKTEGTVALTVAYRF